MIQGIWIIAVPARNFWMMNLFSDLSNPYLEYKLQKYLTDEIVMDPFYPCIKYKLPADPQLDGTDYFIIAEKMQWEHVIVSFNYEFIDCSLSFTCGNDQKAFYKLLKDCLQFWIYTFCDFRKHSWYS